MLLLSTSINGCAKAELCEEGFIKAAASKNNRVVLIFDGNQGKAERPQQ